MAKINVVVTKVLDKALAAVGDDGTEYFILTNARIEREAVGKRLEAELTVTKTVQKITGSIKGGKFTTIEQSEGFEYV